MSDEETENVVCEVVREKGGGILLRKEEDGEPFEEWFPKSQIVFERRNRETGEAIANIPTWLLEKKGW